MTSDVIFVIDGTFEGLLCALFFGFSEHIVPAEVRDETFQLDFFHSSYRIVTEEQKARRVARGLIRKGGYDSYRKIYLAYLSGSSDCYTAVYRFAAMLLQDGSRANYAISTAAGARISKLAGFVGNEAQRFMEFLRFSVSDGGILFAEFAPKSDCMEPVLEHFAKRFSAQKFVLYDTVHKKAGVFRPPNEKLIVPSDRIPRMYVGAEERYYRKLWKQFFHSISIEQRTNIACQKNHLPKRYRMYMTEFFL